MFDRLGTFVSRHWLLVLLAWVGLVGLVEWKAPRWEDITHDGDFAYLPDRMTSVRGEKLLEAAFPEGLSKSQVVLIVARADGSLTEADFNAAREVLRRLRLKWNPDGNGEIDEDREPARNGQGLVVSEWTWEDDVVGNKLISRPGDRGQAVLSVIRLKNEFMAVDNVDLLEAIHKTLEAARSEEGFPEGLELGITGSAAVGTDFLLSAEESIDNTELTTIILVVVILLLVYRAPGLVIVPLATIGVSVWVAMGLVGMLAQFSTGLAERAADGAAWFDFKVFSTTEIFIVVILFGAGTDYCLFLISRYREELRRGREPADAINVALGQVGNALAASALTTIFGLATMFFAEFGKFSNSGPAIALCLAVALVACVTLAPALLRATGRHVFWPFGVGRADDRRDAVDAVIGSSLTGALWQRLSRGIIARPGLILVVSLLLAAPLVYEGVDVPITYDLLNELSPDRPSKQGTELLRRHFSTGETGPVTMLVRQSDGGFDTQDGENNISLLTTYLYHLEYEVRDGEKTVKSRPILSVRSLTEPLGETPGIGLFSPLAFRKLVALKHRETKRMFLSTADPYAGEVTRFDLVLKYDPFSRESVELLGHVRQQLQALSDGSSARWPDRRWPDELSAENRRQLSTAWQGAQFDFIGTTAGISDLEEVTRSDRILIQVLVMAAVLAILILLLRRPIICLYLVLSVLLGYFVTIGVTELFFTWLYGESFQGLDWKVPIFLFVLLIALGADYNIYLTTRVFEEQKRLGPLEGLRVALICTGGIITSCGVIMAGTLASMCTGTLRAMHELGFALSLGVLLDTFVIRTVLVPAFLALLARRKINAGALSAVDGHGDTETEPRAV